MSKLNTAALDKFLDNAMTPILGNHAEKLRHIDKTLSPEEELPFKERRRLYQLEQENQRKLKEK